jgi:hypothetical protein
MITVLFTTEFNDTAGIVIYDDTDNSIVRHCNECDEYSKGYVIVDGNFYQFPMVKDDVNKSLRFAKLYHRCITLYLANQSHFVDNNKKDQLWFLICHSMRDNGMSSEDVSRFIQCTPHAVE